ncbi:response regulator transcription factor [Pedobacter sp.]|uniref:response regulator transcription factor n=1 Tax=Pedobacter sp. TaxID=1411316 RepID=UPI00396C4BF7
MTVIRPYRGITCNEANLNIFVNNLFHFSMYKIALVEDDQKIASLVKTGLEENGYETEIIDNGNAALSLLVENPFHIIILDVMLPHVSGVEIARHLRNNAINTPIIMLTALGAIDDKLTGFQAGADDYLLKPFHFKELLARIEVQLKRIPLAQKNENETNHFLKFEDVEIDLKSKEVKRAGQFIDLTSKEFNLLVLFMQNPKRLLSRQYIAQQVWDINFDTGTNVVDVYINFLRNKIEKNFDRKLIHTKIGMGYILK